MLFIPESDVPLYKQRNTLLYILNIPDFILQGKFIQVYFYLVYFLCSIPDVANIIDSFQASFHAEEEKSWTNLLILFAFYIEKYLSWFWYDIVCRVVHILHGLALFTTQKFGSAKGRTTTYTILSNYAIFIFTKPKLSRNDFALLN